MTSRYIACILDGNGEWVESLRGSDVEELSLLAQRFIDEVRALPREPYYAEGYEPYAYFHIFAAHPVLDTPVGAIIARND